MDKRSRSAAFSASTTGVERAGDPGDVRRVRRRGVGWPWWIVAAGFVLAKTDVLVAVPHHRTEVILALGLGLVLSVLRPRPVGIAVTAAPLLAFTLAPRSTALGIALGFGAFVVLLALFMAIGTVLHTRQHQDS